MKHVFKPGGAWKTKGGQEYTIKAVNDWQVSEFLNDGWFTSLDDALAIEVTPETGSDYETELRGKIKALGGSPAGRSSIKTLENQLAKLEQANGDKA